MGSEVLLFWSIYGVDHSLCASDAVRQISRPQLADGRCDLAVVAVRWWISKRRAHLVRPRRDDALRRPRHLPPSATSGPAGREGGRFRVFRSPCWTVRSLAPSTTVAIELWAGANRASMRDPGEAVIVWISWCGSRMMRSGASYGVCKARPGPGLIGGCPPMSSWAPRGPS